MNSPFGSQLKKVEQTDRSPKKVFVLGVSASAVHAKWLAPDGSIKVKALAVASEPGIFWKSDGADEIISPINIPSELGTLRAADPQFNGPSGNTWMNCSLNLLDTPEKQHDSVSSILKKQREPIFCYQDTL